MSATILTETHFGDGYGDPAAESHQRVIFMTGRNIRHLSPALGRITCEEHRADGHRGPARPKTVQIGLGSAFRSKVFREQQEQTVDVDENR